MKKNSIKKKFSPKVKFRLTGESYPEDRLSAHIEIFGRNTVIIDGCNSVAEYDCESITFSGADTIKVSGNGLELREFDKGVATVKGAISGIEFL